MPGYTYDEFKEVLECFTLAEIIEIWCEAKTGTYSSIEDVFTTVLNKKKEP